MTPGLPRMALGEQVSVLVPGFEERMGAAFAPLFHVLSVATLIPYLLDTEASVAQFANSPMACCFVSASANRIEAM
jgi:hypothetical protein